MALKFIYAGGPPSESADTVGHTVARNIPADGVELITNPVNFTSTDLSADENQMTTGMRSVTNLCSSKSPSSDEIIFSLMARDYGREEASFWFQKLQLIVPCETRSVK